MILECLIDGLYGFLGMFEDGIMDSLYSLVGRALA